MKTVPLLLLLSRTADGFGLTSTRFARASSVCRAVVTPGRIKKFSWFNFVELL
jgi:hypothetical protein